MKYSKYIATITAIFAFLFSFNLAAHGEKEDEKKVKLEIKSFDWNGKIPETRMVVLKNKFGSIRSRNNSGEQIYIHATYQMIGDSPLKPEFKITESDDYLEIEVVYSEPVLDKNKQLRGRTDVSILFPADVGIYAETDSGMIKIDKTASHVEAVTQSGDVKLTTTGLFAVKSDSGNISLRLRGQKQVGTSSVNSKTGMIKADIFDDMDLHLTTKTAGKVTLNDKQQKSGFVLQQGSNLSQLNFITEKGDIKLNVIKPPALVKSVKPSNATSVDIDLREIKKSKIWKPGDPIVERDDKRDNSKKSNQKSSS